MMYFTSRNATRSCVAGVFALMVIVLLGCAKEITPKEKDSPKKEEKSSITSFLALQGNLPSVNPSGVLPTVNKTRGSKSVVTRTDPQDPGSLQQFYREIEHVEKINVFQNSQDFVLLDPWTAVIWPGNLIQGSSLRGNNVPSDIPLYSKRRPGRLYISVVNGTIGDQEDASYVDTEMRPSSVYQAQNKLVHSFLGTSLPAYQTFNSAIVKNTDEFALEAGLNISLYGAKLKAQFGASWDKSHSYCMVKYIQRYFTIGYEPNGGLNDVFTPDITTNDLQPYTGNGNPICYVSSVTYGRMIYLLLEADTSEQSLQASVSGSYDGNSGNMSVESFKSLKNLKVTMIQVGGNAATGLTLIGKQVSLEDISNILTKGATFDENHIGAPISFTVKQLYNNRQVTMENMLSYSYDQVIFTPVLPQVNLMALFSNVTFATNPKDDYQTSNKATVWVDKASVVWKFHNSTASDTIREERTVSFINNESKKTLQDGTQIPFKSELLNPLKFDSNCVYYGAELHVSGGADYWVWKVGSKRNDHLSYDITINYIYTGNSFKPFSVVEVDPRTKKLKTKKPSNPFVFYADGEHSGLTVALNASLFLDGYELPKIIEKDDSSNLNKSR